jgi:hypothetical protein
LPRRELRSRVDELLERFGLAEADRSSSAMAGDVQTRATDSWR